MRILKLDWAPVWRYLFGCLMPYLLIHYPLQVDPIVRKQDAMLD